MSPPVTTSHTLRLRSLAVNPSRKQGLVRFKIVCNSSDVVALLAETVTLGDAIRRFRVRAGMSQRTLAEISGIERSYISMLENNHRKNASYQIITALASAMGIPPSAIYREAEMEMPGPPHENDHAIRIDDPRKAPIIRRISKWSEEKLRRLEQMGLIAFTEGAEIDQQTVNEEGRVSPPQATDQTSA